MKTQTKKLLALLLSLAMVACLLPMTAFAAAAGVYVGDVHMEVGKYLPSGDDSLTSADLTTTAPTSGGYAYLEDNTTLVLNNFSYEGVGYEYADGYFVNIFVELITGEHFTLKLEGENELSYQGVEGVDAIAIDADDTTITGGSLSLAGYSDGIYTKGKLTIENANIEISGLDESVCSECDLTIIDSVLSLYSEFGHCIKSYENDMTITNSTIDATSEDYYTETILCDQGSINITNSTVNATSEGELSVIIRCDTGSVNITNSIVSTYTKSSDSIYAADVLSIVDSFVDLKSDSYSAAYADEGIVIIDSTIVAQTLSSESVFDGLRPDLSGYTLPYKVFAGDDENAPEITDLDSDWHLEKFVKIVAVFELISGDKGEYTKESGKELPFTSNAAFEFFKEVKVDGATIDAANYTAKEGSTIVTLLPKYLDTLAVGKHRIDIVSTNGVASGEFTVLAAPAKPADSAKDDAKIADTADTNSIASLGFLFIASTLAVSGLAVVDKKKFDK